MNWDAIGAIGEIAGAIGVIATLLFLGLQIRQNAQATEASTFDAILAEWRQLERNSFIEHPENIPVFADGLKDFENLSLNNKRLFNYIMSQYALFIENMIQQQQHANIKHSQLAPWIYYYCTLLRSPGGSAWWSQAKSLFSPSVTETIEKHRIKAKDKPDIFALVPFFFGIELQDEEDLEQPESE
jgi:hypothetical protein